MTRGSGSLYEIDQELSRQRREIDDYADEQAEQRRLVKWLTVLFVLSNLAWATTCLLLIFR